MSATPGRSGLHRGASERTWWLLLVVVAAALGVLAWGPWERDAATGAAPLASATSKAAPTEGAGDPASPESLPTPDELSADESSPEPSLTEMSNSRAATPSVPSGTFDDETAPELFLTSEQLAAAVPAASDAAPPAPRLADTGTQPWGLPTGTTITPTGCQVAVTVVDRRPIGFATRSWAGKQVRFSQEVVLLAGSANARTAFSDLVGTVDACPRYRVVAADGTASRWEAQPALEGQGLFPSIVQQVTVADTTGTVENGYRGHLLVGNAIVTWTARTAGVATTLGPPEALADMVQERALAAVRALG